MPVNENRDEAGHCSTLVIQPAYASGYLFGRFSAIGSNELESRLIQTGSTSIT
jgi:hypothetical protein